MTRILILGTQINNYVADRQVTAFTMVINCTEVFDVMYSACGSWTQVMRQLLGGHLGTELLSATPLP